MKLNDSNRPMRVLEKVLQGGLGSGNLGVVMSRRGTGKMAVLTSIALDNAMDGRGTLHVAIGESVADVRAYHDEVLAEILSSIGVTNKLEVTSGIERSKQIYTFRDGKFTLRRLRETLDFLRGGPEFAPTLIELQGWPDFDTVTADELGELRKIARDYQSEIWLAAHTHRDGDVSGSGVPESVARHLDQIEVLIALDPVGEHVKINVVKAHGRPVPGNVHLELDPNTMLIRWR
ncbi:MAG: hypothetical protein AB7O52_13235 [Planctomycetota bacterium]